ncbi:unnamed protein product [Penicillium salamii]|nr:unnamed protein product [Penicillium salamii]CAG7978985.1 unnamed protein product [Penicillium salamii]
MATEGENEILEVISSYSELNVSETQGSASESSEDDISETSEDRAFVVSDGDQPPYSNRSSGSSDCSQHCPDVQDIDSSDLGSCMGRSYSVNKLTSPDWPENTDMHHFQTRYPPG